MIGTEVPLFDRSARNLGHQRCVDTTEPGEAAKGAERHRRQVALGFYWFGWTRELHIAHAAWWQSIADAQDRRASA